VTAESSVRSLVLAPTGRDAPLIVSLLYELGVISDVCANVAELAEQMSLGAGLAIVAEEALRMGDLTLKGHGPTCRLFY
jgi:hypothetical protein